MKTGVDPDRFPQDYYGHTHYVEPLRGEMLNLR